jgi:hypothetical protein
MKIVHSKKSCIIGFGGIRDILPGMNQVSDPEFLLLEKNKVFQDMLKAGHFIIGGSYETTTNNSIEKNDIKEKARSMSEEIQSLSVSEGKDLISKTNDIYILKSMLETDGRKGIVKAIEERISEIKNQTGADLRPVNATSRSESNFEITGTQAEMLGTEIKTDIPIFNKGK